MHQVRRTAARLASTGAALVWLASASIVACSVGAAPPAQQVDAALRDPEASLLTLADRLEQRIEAGTATEEDRLYAYHQARAREVQSAEDALGYAMIAGRLAQLRGLAAGKLVGEVEAHARLSVERDPELRHGAASRLLGTLYVSAPPSLLEHGDSELGLELLEALVERWPEQAQNRLRLVEGYIALGDPDPATPHLCWLLPRRDRLRAPDESLLDDLLQRTGVSERDCATRGCDAASAAGCR